MHLQRFHDATAFSQRAGPFLLAHEAEHNLLLGIAGTLIHDPERYPDPYVATLEEGGAVSGVVIRTPPHNVLLSLGWTAALFPPLIGDLRATYGTLPGALGPKESVLTFCHQWQAASGQGYRRYQALRIYRLEAVKAVSGVPGAMRRATPADRDLLLRWMIGFNQDVYGEDLSLEDRADLARNVERWFDREDRAVHLWEDGRPVSMVGYSSPTPSGIRVSAVYTPPELRRRGYASACVAGVSQFLLDKGYTFCFLFTDLANPTSNHIYQDIGYVPVCDVDQYEFAQT